MRGKHVFEEFGICVHRKLGCVYCGRIGSLKEDVPGQTWLVGVGRHLERMRWAGGLPGTLNPFHAFNIY